jgi:hypothetical protein
MLLGAGGGAMTALRFYALDPSFDDRAPDRPGLVRAGCRPSPTIQAATEHAGAGSGPSELCTRAAESFEHHNGDFPWI